MPETLTLNYDTEKPVEMHHPDLYAPAALAISVPHLDDVLEPEHTAFYRRYGYLAVSEAFTGQETSDALEGMLDLIMGKNPEFKGIHFEAAAREILPTLNLEQRQDAVRKIAYFVEYEARLKALAYHPKLMAVLRNLLGEEPVLFQDMALIKPPRLGREKPWHQDLSYFNYEPAEGKVVGVWIALDEATIANGCMQLLPGLHKDGPILHFKRRDWQMCDTEVLGRTSVASPLKPGGLLLFDGLLPHGTPHNSSAKRRRALQYHYAGESLAKVAATRRMELFGSEGKDVTC
jgi:phytanoyl-CoA hydroxylase